MVGHNDVPCLARSPAQLGFDSRRFCLPSACSSFVPLPSASHYLTCSTAVEKLTLAFPFALFFLPLPLLFPLFC